MSGDRPRDLRALLADEARRAAGLDASARRRDPDELSDELDTGADAHDVEPSNETLLDYLAGRLLADEDARIQRLLVAHPEAARRLLDLENLVTAGALADAEDTSGIPTPDLAAQAGWKDFQQRLARDEPGRRETGIRELVDAEPSLDRSSPEKPEARFVEPGRMDAGSEKPIDQETGSQDPPHRKGSEGRGLDLPSLEGPSLGAAGSQDAAPRAPVHALPGPAVPGPAIAAASPAQVPMWLAAMLLVGVLGLGVRLAYLESELARPWGNLASLELVDTRSGEVPEIVLEPDAPLRLAIEPSERCPAYRAELDGPRALRVERLTAETFEPLTLLLPRPAPGDYRLELYGCEPERRVGEHRFRVAVGE